MPALKAIKGMPRSSSMSRKGLPRPGTGGGTGPSTPGPYECQIHTSSSEPRVDYSGCVYACAFLSLNVVVNTGSREHHAGMAHLSIEGESVTLILSAAERVEAFPR